MHKKVPKDLRENAWNQCGMEFQNLSCEILNKANKEFSRSTYLREVAELLLSHLDCDSLEILILEDSKFTRWKINREAEGKELIGVIPRPSSKEGREDDTWFKQEFLLDRLKAPSSCLSPKGSFYTEKTNHIVFKSHLGMKKKLSFKEEIFRYLVWVPFQIGNRDKGLLEFVWKRGNTFPAKMVPVIENLVKIIGIATYNHRIQFELGERVKELTCLYGLARSLERRDLELNAILQEVVEILPPAWQYPDIACAKIDFDEYTFKSPGWRNGIQKQKADIVFRDIKRGHVEICYTEQRPPAAEGPFLFEERTLLNIVGDEIGRLIEKRENEKERNELKEHLRHTDRLATIGQLAAGVAHELNEPLGNILGFAQLSQKQEDLPQQTLEDLEKIIKAALYAREVIKKLMLFARVQPPTREWIDLNQIVEQDLYFFDGRAEKSGIVLVRELSNELPEIMADGTQIHQVLVNLVVNAIQAMPRGGSLKIETLASENEVILAVEDQGIGMSPEIKEQIFVPFFTTKEVGEGTGLGLAVVHGIVTAHDGKIDVRSEKGKGSRFDIHFPIISKLPERNDLS
jgi:signal transduction histidine kinase